MAAAMVDRPGPRRRGLRLLPAAGAVVIVVLLVALAAGLPRPPSMPGGPYDETRSGDFLLNVTATKPQYVPGEPIEVFAELTYDGPAESIRVSGVVSLVNGFGVRQLDGPLAMGPGWDLPCIHHELRRDAPLRVPFQKSGSYAPGEPNADFYAAWLRDPVFSLPEGRWELTAYSDFFAGAGCRGDRVEMQASIVLLVGQPEAKPSLPPSTPDPTVSPTPVMTAADFGARLAARELDGTTVVVDGRIADEPGRGPLCPLGGPCLMGTLEGAEPTVEVYAPHLPTTQDRAGWTVDDGRTWRWWVSPQHREGLLVLMVDRRGSVTYVGRLHQPVDADAWAPSDVRGLDIESLDQFEVLIVDGWLWDTRSWWEDGLVPCAAVGIPDGLPDGQCSVRGGLLTDWRPSSEWLEAPPARNRGRLEPAAAVVLMGDPLYMVGGEERAQPVRGRFVIAPRLWATNACAPHDSLGPCWQWQMLAVVTVATIGEPSPLTPPASTPATR